MSGRAPTTRSSAVSDSHLPTLIPGRRVRPLGAALAGGSPPSSSSPSGSGRSQSPIPESVHPLTASLLQQAALSQGATSSNPPVASTSGARASSLPLGGFLEEVEMGSDPALPPDEDIVMESATTRDLAKALRDLASRSPAPIGAVAQPIQKVT